MQPNAHTSSCLGVTTSLAKPSHAIPPAQPTMVGLAFSLEWDSRVCVRHPPLHLGPGCGHPLAQAQASPGEPVCLSRLHLSFYKYPLLSSSSFCTPVSMYRTPHPIQ